MHKHLPLDESTLSRFCVQHHIRRLSLFGSTLRGEQRPGSDVDLLVDFEPGQKPGLIGMATMESELTALLGGCPVDMRTAEDLSRYFREEVLRTAVEQYARR